MPLYEYQCEDCFHKTSLVLLMSADIPETTQCTNMALGAGHFGTAYRMFGFNTPNDSYAKPLVSDSLAMHPNQIEEHRRKFPDITVHPDGRPEFTSFKQHEDYLKATGFQKKRQKSRRGHKKPVQNT